MRWFWIDRFTEFVRDQRATAVKNVSLAEEHLHDHFPGLPMMPNSLIVEGMAQTGGLLVSASSGFQERVVLAKLSKSTFHFPALPGQTLTYRVTAEQVRKDGALVNATSHVGDELQGEAEIFFAHLSDRESRPLFDPRQLYIWLKVLGVFDVGVNGDGTPLDVPQSLVPEGGFS